MADGEVLDLRKKNSFYVYIDLLNEDKERIGPGGRIEMQAGRLSNEKMTVHAELPDEAAFIKVRHPAYAFT